MLNSIGIASVLVATWLGWHAISSLVAGLRSPSWPVARGLLVSVTIKKKRNGDDEEAWCPMVRYSYSVGGKKYRGTRIRFGVPKGLLWLDPSHPSFRQLRRRARVDVYYSPLWPSFSALQTGVSPFVLITLAAVGALAWFGYSALTFVR
jgi:hypothetical protein